jgi:hypothetical protein
MADTMEAPLTHPEEMRADFDLSIVNRCCSSDSGMYFSAGRKEIATPRTDMDHRYD